MNDPIRIIPDATPRAARRMVLRLSNQIFPMFIGAGTHTYKVIQDALPADAAVVGARLAFDGRTVELLVESGEFPETPEGDPYPEIMPVMTGLT